MPCVPAEGDGLAGLDDVNLTRLGVGEHEPAAKHVVDLVGSHIGPVRDGMGEPGPGGIVKRICWIRSLETKISSFT